MVIPSGWRMVRRHSESMKPIMIQATGSDAGKTTLVAGLCRLFANRGLRVAPFKAQNMALNSYVTAAGGEIGRATAVQAAGARQVPSVHMNPLLLKPKADDVAQLIVHGQPLRDVSASEYFLAPEQLQQIKLDAITESIAYLRSHYDLIIAEGAGSCAEPNLRRLDVVNMGVAHLLDARVFIVGDIDRGGVFASFLGTVDVMRLTEPADLALVEGFLINKFRGDPDVLRPGLEFMKAHCPVPIAGVLPFVTDLRLEEEDRVRERRCAHPDVDIAVLYLPHISNANDVQFLADEANVQVRFVRAARELGVPDAVILPGTKNTSWDLDYIRRTGLAQAVEQLVGRVPIIGICGGYQMLGRTLYDPDRLESELGTMTGFGLLDFEVTFRPHKTLATRTYTPTPDNPFAAAGPIVGYEIHTGDVQYGASPPCFVHDAGVDGAVDPDRLIFGTHVHDVFSNPAFTRVFIDVLRRRNGLAPLTGPLTGGREAMDDSYEQLAAALDRLAVF
jgi:adenosylcobyric acid synthase